MAKPEYIIELEFRIIDSQNNLIGKYSAIGKGKNINALYYGYSGEDALKKFMLML